MDVHAARSSEATSISTIVIRVVAFFMAVAAPFLLHLPLPPAISHPAQIASVFGWGLVLLLVPAASPGRAVVRAAAPLIAVLAIVGLACAASILTGGEPSSPGVATLGIIAFAAAVMLHGASWGGADPDAVFKPFAIALVVAGLCGTAMAIFQIFGPQVRDDTFVAMAPLDGRASGNLNQANHFAATMLWSLLALIGLSQRGTTDSPQARRVRWPLVLISVFLLFGMVLTGSRAALVATLLLSAWGILDRRIDRDLRLVLGLAPLTSLALVGLVRLEAHAATTALFVHPNAPDITSYRSTIWSQSLAMIAHQPWLGVGWGEFNFAWTLTPFESRAAGLVGNAHDLPLQLAVELGVPLTLVILALLAFALRWGVRHVRRVPGAPAVRVTAALMIVVLVCLLSVFEFPLWYAYLLYPAAWAWGLALGFGSAHKLEPDAAPVPPVRAPAHRAWRVLGMLMAVSGASAWLDYQNIVGLYVARPDLPSFEERIRGGQASPLFSALADYVETTHPLPGQDQRATVQRSARVLFNGWLMLSMANQLDAQGQTDKARYLAARLREFNLPGAKAYFAPCDNPAVAVKPFQCTPPTKTYDWRDFK